MEDKANLGNTFDRSYNKLVSGDDFKVDEDPLYSSQEQQQVSMSLLRAESMWNHPRLLTVSQAVLAAFLLALNIGLGVYYNNLTGGQRSVTDITREVVRLQASYNAVVQRKEEAKGLLDKEIRQQQITKWELEHQKRRATDYKKQAEKIQMEISLLQSHIPLIKEGCRHCLPGWSYIRSACYYFPFSDSISRKTWQEGRQFCVKYGADLAVIDTREKQLAIHQLIINSNDPSSPMSQNGIWIGLRDVEEERLWKWLDGTRLIEGYWMDGEPNNQGNEDCVAMYPKNNPFKSWNDAPCSYSHKWICEMQPRSVSYHMT